MSAREVFIAATVVVAVFAARPAAAQIAAANAAPSAPFGMPMENPIYFHAILNQLEGRFGTGSSFRWSGEAWVGGDTNRLWLKSEGDVNSRGEMEDGQQEVFYDRPLTTYFDLQAGLRSDLDSRAGRTWAAFGVQGLAPYFIDVSATAYASDSGQYAAKLEGSTDLLITQRLILQPQIEMNVYTKADAARGIGAGLSDLDAGLRLRYDINRKFAPYVGVVYTGKYGGTADFARAAGEPSGGLQFVFGVRTWL